MIANSTGPVGNLLFFLLFAPLIAGAHAPTTTITVIDIASHAPLANVRLELRADGRVVAGTTDLKGHVALSLVGGRYCLSVEIFGYLDPLADTTGSCRSLTLAGHLFVLELLPTCAIVGVVTDEEGVPVQAARVDAIPTPNSGDPIQSVEHPVLTDDRGAYRLFGLAPGQYYVAVSPSGQDTTVPAFAPVFFGSNDYRQARVIDLRTGQTEQAANVVIDLHTTTKATLAGNILDPCVLAEQCQAAVVLFFRNGLVSPIDYRLTDSNGKFQFDDVPLGDYFIAAWTPAVEWPATNQFPTAIQRAAIGPISIGETGQSTELTILPTIKVAGKVSLVGGEVMPAACPDLDQLGLHSEDGWPASWTSPITSKSSVGWGPLPTGTYRVVIPSSAITCELSSIGIAASTFSASHTVELETDSAPLHLAFARVDGEISGVVRNSDASASQGYVLLSGTNPTSIRRLAQIVNGHFIFTNLPVGTFNLAVFADLSSASSFTGKVSNRIAAVTIARGHEHIHDLVLNLP